MEERKDDVDHLVGIETIEAAHKAVSSYFSRGKKDIAIEVSQHVADKKTPGDPDNFHNLAAQLAKEDQNLLAIQVVNNGLELFPENIDLLADGVKYNTTVGQLALAEELYTRLSVIDHSSWNWRAFVFVGDYLETLGKIDEAMDLYKQFRRALPNDERGYSQPGSYYQTTWKAPTRRFLFFERGVQKTRRCSQCANMLAQTYIATGEYRKAIEAADRALEANAEEQPSTNEAFILWHRALAEDSLIHQKTSKQDQECDVGSDEFLTLCRNCVVDYRNAMDAPDAQPILWLSRTGAAGYPQGTPRQAGRHQGSA